MNSAAHRPSDFVISYRVSETPTFSDGPRGACTFLRSVAVETLAGAPLGLTTLYVQQSEQRLGPPRRFIERGRLVLDLVSGHLKFDVTVTETYNADQTAAAHRTSGTVSEGSGGYAGASGSLDGSGVILFDAEDTPMPFLTYHARLRFRPH